MLWVLKFIRCSPSNARWELCWEAIPFSSLSTARKGGFPSGKRFFLRVPFQAGGLCPLRYSLSPAYSLGSTFLPCPQSAGCFFLIFFSVPSLLPAAPTLTPTRRPQEEAPRHCARDSCQELGEKLGGRRVRLEGMKGRWSWGGRGAVSTLSRGLKAVTNTYPQMQCVSICVWGQ